MTKLPNYIGLSQFPYMYVLSILPDFISRLLPYIFISLYRHLFLTRVFSLYHCISNHIECLFSNNYLSYLLYSLLLCSLFLNGCHISYNSYKIPIFLNVPYFPHILTKNGPFFYIILII